MGKKCRNCTFRLDRGTKRDFCINYGKFCDHLALLGCGNTIVADTLIERIQKLEEALNQSKNK